MPKLSGLLRQTSEKFPERTAFIEPEQGRITYGALQQLASRLSQLLSDNGVEAGDRVGVCLPKSILSVGAIFGILEAEAAYVPVDVEAPENRNGYILENCQAKALLVSSDQLETYASHFEGKCSVREIPGLPLALLILDFQGASPLDIPSGLAYILYTSGSTGLPKGVLITHRNAFCFVQWAGQAFGISEKDVFSSIAPFHFDLSVFDLFTAVLHGASVVLIGSQMAKNPMQLAALIDEHHISVWYATPTTLKMMLRFGRMERYQHDSLRIVLFAGEVFPITPLREIKSRWHTAAFYNLYGPTETNVCTFHPIPELIPEEQSAPYPIGIACPYARCRILVDEQSHLLKPGLEGELLVAGESVMAGYLNLPERNERAFWTEQGEQWYRTGDIVRVDNQLEMEYVSRKDRMVKRYGYRIELGEIEAALHHHPDIAEAGVVSVQPEGQDVQIIAFYSTKAPETALPVLALKEFLVQNLPAYMVPDKLVHLVETPKTTTHKVNYPALMQLV